ncbi:MAG: hypothetical protein M1813_007742 [Trichoglossum hirsutum]|nr:MAG: hypothetical protein M1813_007742 [Trichoglossum hirsutum]
MAETGTASTISYNPSLQNYYYSLESRVGYRLFLGGTRHFGHYPAGTLWPFPISRALRAMEDHLFNSLDLVAGATVLDAGCGVGHVAIHMARKGLRVVGIDVIDHHLVKAKRNIKAAGLEKQVSAQKMDYHYLDGIEDQSMDGVYTLETLVHATDPERAISQFYRVLKPGGSLALYEYDHAKRGTGSNYLESAMDKVNTIAAMPANIMFDEGVLPLMLEDAGFENIRVRDLSLNIEPMLRLFFIVAYLPFLIIRFFGLEKWFINTVAGVEGYRGRKLWRYISVICTKPGSEVEKRGLGAVEDKKAR